MQNPELKVLATLRELSKFYTPSSYLLACSGGCDSAVLLDILGRNQQQIKIPIKVIYINHGWSKNAEFWGETVKTMAEKWGFCFELAKLNLDNSKNAEAIAREARYKKFAELLPENGVLLTAHHLNDQAETFLINLLRASALEGLTAMPERKKFAQGEHWRPLLGISRADLEFYALEKNIKFVNDESNLDTRYLRNWLRKEVLSKIAENQPQIYQNIAFSAQCLAKSRKFQEQILDKYCKADYLDVNLIFSHNLGDYLDLIIRRWLFLQNLATPPQKQLLEFIRQVKTANAAQCEYSNLILYFYNKEIKIYDKNYQVKIIDKYNFLQGKKYQIINYEFLENKDSIRKKIKSLKIPSFLKNKIPVLIIENQIVWVKYLGFFKEIEGLELINKLEYS